jgi:hypothetical protein
LHSEKAIVTGSTATVNCQGDARAGIGPTLFIINEGTQSDVRGDHAGIATF